MMTATDVYRVAEELSARFAELADETDRTSRFPHENIAAAKATGYVLAGLPEEFGGWGVGVPDLCRTIRILGRGCPSTTLGLLQHQLSLYLLGELVRRGAWDGAAFLREVAANRWVIGFYGGLPEFEGRVPRSATRVEGGWLFNGRAGWGTLSPAADFGILSCPALIDSEPIAVSGLFSFSDPGVKPQNDWDALGMRASGSQDLVFENVFVPDERVFSLIPDRDRLSPDPNNLNFLAFSYGVLFMMSLYLGVADAARRILIDTLTTRTQFGSTQPLAADPRLPSRVGEVEIIWRSANAWLDLLIMRHPTAAGWGATEHLEAMAMKDYVSHAAVEVVTRAMEILGGVALYRRTGLEKLYRDVRSATVHPLNHLAATELLGKHALSEGRPPR
ncbi:MAG: acyl-CoA dehydrogenase family protein [Chloroflexota bacterium]|nr:acyl-CoA/acyl-ACP dehydrogenase [Dehalococcoidia bacterium]MDW8253122.1 acyl-CoA dehydrogenase family protein [Chloroflexota bacterium]